MLLFDDGKDQVLFDCHVTRPSLMACLLKSFETDTSVADMVINDFKIDRLKGIFVSHSHHDHVLDMPYFAKKCECDIYGSSSTANIALGNGVPIEKIHSYDESMTFNVCDFNITIIPSIHSKAHWYNNDLGETINEPLSLPAPKKAFKEGGSVDFLIKHGDKTYLIRPSYNYLENQLNNISADVLFLGVGGLASDSVERHDAFFKETIDKVNPKTVIPVHWDNFFSPLYGKIKYSSLLVNNKKSIDILSEYCKKKEIDCIVQLPLTSLDL